MVIAVLGIIVALVLIAWQSISIARIRIPEETSIELDLLLDPPNRDEQSRRNS
jgi:hypothetical protein